jgi:L-threonylcarbamoyladenylate synthase
MRSGNQEPRVVILEYSTPHAIEWAAEQLASGGVIALPTDTVYGIAASLAHPDALRRIFEIKGRPANSPLPVLVASPVTAQHLSDNISTDVELLLDRYWPGPLTIVVPARPGMPVEVTAGGTTVGLRMPNHPLAIEVINRAGGAIACTSANRSGEAPACDAQRVAATIGDDLDLILDGGIAPGGVPSSVIDFLGGELHILRDGAIPAEHIIATWAEIRSSEKVM